MKKLDPQEIINALQTWRAKHNYTQTEAASRIGINRILINRWECGRNYPSNLAIEKMYDMGILQRPTHKCICITCGKELK